jgi:type IV pilus assembly protein PilQ
MKHLTFILFLLVNLGFAQIQDARINSIKNQLDVLSVDNAGLTEQVKTEINVNNISLSSFLLAVSEIHQVNLNLAPELKQINIVNNFNNVSVADLLVFLCKEYDLTIDFTGNILSIKKYVPPAEAPEKRIIPVTFHPAENIVSIDANADKLYEVFKRIMDESGKNLVFTPGMENKLITSYIKQMPFDAAMDKLALANHLYVEKSKDNFYIFEDDTPSNSTNGTNMTSKRHSNLNFKVLDADLKLLEVDFNNTPISSIINAIDNT